MDLSSRTSDKKKVKRESSKQGVVQWELYTGGWEFRVVKMELEDKLYT